MDLGSLTKISNTEICQKGRFFPLQLVCTRGDWPRSAPSASPRRSRRRRPVPELSAGRGRRHFYAIQAMSHPQSWPLRVDLLRAGMRATSTLTRMGAAAREQLRGASAVDSRTDGPRCRALHGQHSRANARETEQVCGDSSSGGAHFSMWAGVPLTGLGAWMAAGWRPGELTSGGAPVEVLSSATVFSTGAPPIRTTAAELS